MIVGRDDRGAPSDGRHRFAWVLTGRVVDSRSDDEPLPAQWQPAAVLAHHLLAAPRRRSAERFETGRDSRG